MRWHFLGAKFLRHGQQELEGGTGPWNVFQTGIEKKLGEKGLTTHVARCCVPDCGINAHGVIPKGNRLIHTLPQFKGMTCFQIIHSKLGRQIWNVGTSGKYKSSVRHNHPIVKQLRRLHGKSETIRRKRKADDDGNESDTDTTATVPSKQTSKV